MGEYTYDKGNTPLFHAFLARQRPGQEETTCALVILDFSRYSLCLPPYDS